MSLSNIKITDLNYFAPIPLKAGETRKISNRLLYGIVFSPDGICHYTQNGITYTNDNTHVLLLPKSGSYTIFCESDAICPLINFDCKDTFPEILSFSVENSKNLLSEFNKIYQAWAFNKEDIYYTAIRYLYEIFEQILQKEHLEDTQMPQLLIEAKTYISAHYTDYKLEIDEISKALNVSEVYFRKLFKAHYGVPPMKYINSMRIRQAKAMLRDQMISITAVAELSGFSSIYSFSRTFKLAVGVTPSEYRESKFSK